MGRSVSSKKVIPHLGDSGHVRKTFFQGLNPGAELTPCTGAERRLQDRGKKGGEDDSRGG